MTGGLTVKANIAFKEVIKKLATNALVASASCDFSPTSTITLTERIIQPVELQVNLQLCKYDFVNRLGGAIYGLWSWSNITTKVF